MTILENDMNKYSGCWTDEDTSDDECKENTENCFMARGETSEDGFGNPKIILILVELTNKDPCKLGYLKEGGNSILQEHHRKSCKGKWYLDSACSSHMTDDKNLFKEVTKINGENVKIGDDSKGNVVGTGTVPFGNNCDIIEVYVVDGLNYNLLRISRLCDLGYEVKFKKTGCAIEDETCKIILPRKRYGNVYILDGIENLDSHLCLASISDDPWLWHKKLGNSSMHLIENLSKHDLVIGLPKLNFSRNHVCNACHIGKQTRNTFKTKDIVSTTKLLQLLHMDLFGPTRTASIGGKLYAFVIIDDYSRFIWVIFLSHKDETLKHFEIFYKRIEREKGYLITTIQSDHGGEFESRSFEGLCNDQGSFRVYNKCTLSVEESVHVIFDENNSMAEKGIIASDEDTSQEVSQTNKPQKSTDIPSIVTKSTNEPVINSTKQQKESTTFAVGTRPNEWRSKPEYPRKFIIGDPSEGMKTRGSLKKKENIALIYQVEPKKVDEALKDSSWIQAMFTRGKVDTTLFIKRSTEGNLTIQIYVDDIIFGSTNLLLCKDFSNLMQSEFEMSMMGELTFFLGLQIHQSKNGIFICQTKYTKELIQKFGMSNAKSIGIPMSPSISLDMDEQGKSVDETKYHGMIGSLLYLRLVDQISCSVFVNMPGDKEDRKSTSGTCQLLGKALISWNSKKQGSVVLSTTEAEMRDHIIGEDYELWDIVTDGPLATLKINDERVEVPNTRHDCTAEDLKKWEKNAKAKKWLVCGLSPDEYNRIQNCIIAKEIWDTLQVAYEEHLR
ncbi:uncharacterized protein LOC142173366 [Nicotiana tabacum]|uniref:Uncharacterized protein LOC142173366 n=1 Tax=Nicotiana tabacum TaxID=4097 RepID=A0AC58TCV0_TOBAC